MKEADIKKTESYQKLSDNLNIAWKFYNEVKNDAEEAEMWYYDETEGKMVLVPSVTAEQKIEFIKRFSNNVTAMAWLNYLNAQDELSTYLTTAYNTMN